MAWAIVATTLMNETLSFVFTNTFMKKQAANITISTTIILLSVSKHTCTSTLMLWTSLNGLDSYAI